MLATMHKLNEAAKVAEADRKQAKAELLMKYGVIDGKGKGKILCDEWSYSFWQVKDSEPTVITEDMIGDTFGGRKGFQSGRLTKLKGRGR